MSVEWRPLRDVLGYHVSTTGRVARVRGEKRRPLKPSPNHGGYLVVTLTRERRRVRKRVHLLVLETFVGPRPTPRHVGAHAPKNDKRNNAITNLRWALPEENERDKRAHGTQPRGRVTKRRPNSATVAQIRERAETESYTKIAASLGLHRTSVQRIVDGVRRANVPRGT